MALKSESELKATREKLRVLERAYSESQQESPENTHTRELTLRSLKGLMNQLKEEIACYEAHTGASETRK